MPDPQPDPDAAWWTLALDPAARAADARLDPAAPGPDYGGYLLLDRLLGAQAPVSSVPDERVFILTHQLFELVFKGMIFDVGVIARTFEALLALDADDFIPLALESAPDDRGPAAFWRPAMTAAARLRHAARAILPPVMQLLGRGEGDDVLFSTLEFGYFRALLEPSSGFQTAQLRLIQRALGKAPLLHVRVFPGERYGADAEAGGCPVEHVALGDPFVLRAEHARAFPDADGPAARAAALDALAHAVLARLPASGEAPTAVPLILAGDVDRAAERFRATLARADTADAAAERFRADLDAAAETENARRRTLGAARAGARALHARPGGTCLAFVLDRIVDLDDALHAPDADSFLTVHRKTVRRHVADDSGTGGGGMPYLVTSQRYLLPLFPALVAYRDLAGAEPAAW